MNRSVPYVFFTDLDGTLLDDNYTYDAARPALDALRARHLPLVFCTSKTREEVDALRTRLNNEDPFIVENGAAIFIPRGYFPFPVPGCRTQGRHDVIEFGTPYPTVRAALRRAAQDSECDVVGFAEMSAAAIAGLCGLSLEDARRAKAREYDEPFLLRTDSPALVCSLFRRIEQQGLTWTRGGRFYHVRGHHNKDQAARILASCFRRALPFGIVTVGLGDGPNDFSLLRSVDVPVLLPSRSKGGCVRRGHRASGWILAEPFGPGGWNRAVLRILDQAA